MNEKIRKILLAGIFGIAFGYVEAAVVIYLRQLFFPEGFNLPFYPFLFYFGSKVNIPLYVHTNDYLVEICREAATITILITLAWLAGKTIKEKIGIMLISWGMWDIFYYVFLFLVIHWPTSFFTMDIIFLVPVPWLAPVIVPIIASLAMIAYGTFLLLEYAR